MVLNLEQLRADYKSTYKADWALAEKVNVLIEVTKIELKYQRQNRSGGKENWCISSYPRKGHLRQDIATMEKALQRSRSIGNYTQEKRTSSQTTYIHWPPNF